MTTTGRRFTMLDGMILIAASAVGFWLTKVTVSDGVKWEELPWAVWGFLHAGLTGQSSREYWIGGTAELSVLFLPSLLAWTLAVPILRFKGPRPHWRRIWRQPGIVACAWVLLTLLGLAVFGAALFLASKSGKVFRGLDAEVLIIFGLVACGLAVIVAWTTLFLSRSWRCERSWIDRLGRVLGLAWIGYAALGLAVLFDRP